jgi:hypothetical protein
MPARIHGFRERDWYENAENPSLHDQLFAYRAEQCYNTVSYVVHPTDSREASRASLFPVVYELRIVGA